MATDDLALMSEVELIAFLHGDDPCYTHETWVHEEAIEARMRLGADAASEAYLDMGDLDEERLESRENRLLLLAGTVCVQAGRADLWSTIWRVWHAGELWHEDEFEVLREMTARARAGERSLVDEEAAQARWHAG